LLAAWLKDNPFDAQGWFLLGASCHAAHKLGAASEAFARCLAHDPANLEAHLALVSVLQSTGDTRGALVAGQKALKLLPGQARLRYAVALCLEDLERSDEALEQYDLALRLAPELEDAYRNRGLLLSRLGRLEEAESNQRQFLHAVPRSPIALTGLIDVLLARGRLDEADRALDSLEADPHAGTDLHVRRGVLYACRRKFSRAAAEFDEARVQDAGAVSQFLRRIAPSADPDAMLSPMNIYLGYSWRALGRCDWKNWEPFVAEMRRAASMPGVVLEPAVGFMSRLLPLSGVERLGVCRQVARRLEASHAVLPAPAPVRRSRVRVGVLSPDFREHLNAYLLRPFFELLDRDRFEAFAYSLSIDDGSEIRAQVRGAADRFLDLNRSSDRDAALAIRADDIDILLDVGGFTTGARFGITAQRPARLQVNYLGFSCSLGSDRVDYAVVDGIAGREAEEWTEARVLLPDTHFLYDFRTRDPDVPVARSEYGLPEDAIVYCAFHQAEKISPDIFDRWMQILAQVPGAALWLRAISDDGVRNLRAHATARGIDPDRLVFAPFEPRHHPRYLARHRLGDLMLDAPHHNAMTSACDALRMGLPLLTSPGDSLASRTGESLLRAAGVPELISANLDDYVHAAVSLGCEPGRLRQLRRRLVQNRTTAPLFDTASRVRALEAAFVAMYEKLARGEPPATLEI